MPVSLASVPHSALAGIPVYLRVDRGHQQAEGEGPFTLYCAEHAEFTTQDQKRLLASGTRFVYIPMSEQRRFRQQVEESLDSVVGDPTVAVSTKAALVYETSFELIDELLCDPELGRLAPRVGNLSRAVTALVMNNPSAFSHLFAASHHDFYTATHLVNVATWAVPLAYALGYRTADTLNQVCQGALLHDIGKLYVPEEVLNKTERLTDSDWEVLKRHPELGFQHLQSHGRVGTAALNMTRQHHERLDGSGYPQGLTAGQIDPLAKICAVVDSFDAMTALRPFKKRALTVQQACAALQEDTPDKYDADIVAAWIDLLKSVKGSEVRLPGEPNKPKTSGPSERRCFGRYQFNCPARMHLLSQTPKGWIEGLGKRVTTHNLSRSGLGVLSRTAFPIGSYVHVYLQTSAWKRQFLRALTVRCRPYSDGWYEIGLKFVAVGPRLDDTSGTSSGTPVQMPPR